MTCVFPVSKRRTQDVEERVVRIGVVDRKVLLTAWALVLRLYCNQEEDVVFSIGCGSVVAVKVLLDGDRTVQELADAMRETAGAEEVCNTAVFYRSVAEDDERGGDDRWDLTLSYISSTNTLTLHHPVALLHAPSLCSTLNHLLDVLPPSRNLPLRSLPLLSEAQSLKLTHFSSTLASNQDTSLAPTRLHTLILRNTPPNKPAVVTRTRTLTYSELHRYSHALALQLSGTTIATLLPRTHLAPICHLAILLSGAAVLALDTSHPAARHHSILQQVPETPAMVLTTDELAAGLRGEYQTVVVSDAFLETLPTTETLCNEVSEDSTAWITTTSGSTGAPKLISLSHAALARSIFSHQPFLELHAGSKMLQFAAPSFDVSIAEVFGALAAGATVVVPDEEERMNNLGRFMREMRVTHAVLTPSVARLLEPDEVVSAGLKIMVLTGEGMAEQDIGMWANRLKLVNLYGPAECSIWATGHTMSPGCNPSTIGRPLWGPLQILEISGTRPLPIGAIGEIVIHGIGVGRYLGRTDQGGFVDGGFRTGDSGYWTEAGDIVVLGRFGSVVKIRGQRLDIKEVEGELTKRVATVAVVLPDDGPCQGRLTTLFPAGGGGGGLKILEDRNGMVEEMRRELAETLPRYMVPSLWIPVGSLPLMASGKLDRKAIAKWVREFGGAEYAKILAVSSSSSDRDTGSSGESTPILSSHVEKTLRQIWSQVLGLGDAEPEGSFLHLGGDSISAMQVLSRCRAEGLATTIRDIMSSTDIRDLASRVGEEKMQVAPAIELPHTEDVLFPLSRVQRLWFDIVGRQPPSNYTQSFLLGLPMSASMSKMRVAMRELLVHHPVLRARFQTIMPGRWMQFVSSDIGSSLRIVSHSVEDLEAVSTITRKTQQSALDIFHGPVIAADYFTVSGSKTPVLFLTAHHLVIDLVSWRILLSDLSDLLSSRRLPAQAPSFQNWTCSRSEDQVNSIPRTPAITYGMCATTSTTLPAPTGITLDLILAAIFLSSPQDEPPVIHNESHGRSENSEIDPSSTVGWFTTIYRLSPFRRRPKSLSSALSAVRACRVTTEMKAPAMDRNMSVLFNFRGGSQPLPSTFERVTEELQPTEEGADNVPRLAEVEIEAVLRDGLLELVWRFPVTKRAEIQRWAEECERVLRGTRSGREEVSFPCRKMQKAMIMSSRARSELYALELEVEFRNADIKRLINAWKRVVQSHDGMRIDFVERDDGDIRCVESNGDSIFTSGVVPSTQDGGLPHRLHITESGPLITANLRIHHAAADGKSLAILLRDWKQVYQGFDSPGRRFNLSQYISFVERESFDVSTTTESLKYWRSYLNGVKPCYFPVCSTKRQRVLKSVRVPSFDARDLPRFCRAHGITPSSFFTAVWSIVLQMCTGNETTCFGYLASGRDVAFEGIEDAVGCFVNMLTSRVDFESADELSAIQLIQMVQRESMDSLEHQRVSLGDILKETKTPGQPLFNSILTMENYGLEAEGRPGDIEMNIHSVRDPTEFDLVVHIEESKDNQGHLFTSVKLDYWEPVVRRDDVKDAASIFAGIAHEMMTDATSTVRELRERVLTYDGMISRPIGQGEAVASTHPAVVQKLQTVFSQVLDVASALVLPETSFLQLGGDSISAMQAVAKLQKIGVEVTVNDILRCSDLRALSHRARISVSPAAVEVVKEGEFFQLTPIQKLYFESGATKDTVFVQHVLLDLGKGVSDSELGDALQELIKRHAMLRARFQFSDGIWSQKIISDTSSFMLETFPPTTGTRTVAEAMQTVLDISEGPLFAAARIGDRKLYLVAHHLVVDLVSWQVMVSDLEDLLITGAIESQPSISFQTWANRTQQGGAAVARQPWTEWGLSTSTPNTYADRTTTTLSIPARQLHGNEERTILAAVAHSFSQSFPGRSPACIFAESHGRQSNEFDVSATVGWFTTISKVDFKMGQDIIDTARSIRRVDSSSRPRSGPMEILVNYHGRTRAGSAGSKIKSLKIPVDVPIADSSMPRWALIEIEAEIEGGVMEMEVSWNRHMAHQDRLQEWVNRVRQTMGIAEQCIDEIQSVAPADQMQNMILEAQSRWPDSGMYVTKWEWELTAPEDINTSTLLENWEALVQQHAILRTTFSQDGSSPGQYLQTVRSTVAPPTIDIAASRIKLSISHALIDGPSIDNLLTQLLTGSIRGSNFDPATIAPAPSIPAYPSACGTWRTSRVCLAGLLAVATHYRLTPAAALRAVWAMCIGRMFGHDDEGRVGIDFLASTRMPGMEGVVGPMVETRQATVRVAGGIVEEEIREVDMLSETLVNFRRSERVGARGAVERDCSDPMAYRLVCEATQQVGGEISGRVGYWTGWVAEETVRMVVDEVEAACGGSGQ